VLGQSLAGGGDAGDRDGDIDLGGIGIGRIDRERAGNIAADAVKIVEAEVVDLEDDKRMEGSAVYVPALTTSGLRAPGSAGAPCAVSA